MNQNTREKFLNEAIRIGNELISLGDFTTSGLSWNTMMVNPDNIETVLWQKSETLYSGVSGIVLFLIELYEKTKMGRFLEAAISGMRWVESHCQHNLSYGFYSGRSGIAYTLIRLADVTKQRKHITNALTLIQDYSPYQESNHTVDDLLSGRAGALLGLLHLYQSTGKQNLLKKIDQLVQILIENAHCGPKGLYWDRSPHNINGLCGFSHGASGVGYVFLELGRFFQNEAFFFLADQAFAYESHLYDKEKGNWPDLRQNTRQAEKRSILKNAYILNNLAPFQQTGDMNAWCHGAAGIGLARIRGWELLRKPSYADDVQRAIEKNIATQMDHRSYTLCHGGGGNAELFLEAYRLWKDPVHLLLAKEVGLQALHSKKDTGTYLSGYGFGGPNEDQSLLMGIAGIGHFFLRLVYPLNMRSILAPRLTNSPVLQFNQADFPNLSLSQCEISKRLADKTFPKSAKLARALQTGSTNICSPPISRNSHKPLPELFLKKFTSITSLEPEHVEVINLELRQYYLDQSILGNTFKFIKEEMLHEQAVAYLSGNFDDFSQLKFSINPDVQLIKLTHWPNQKLPEIQTPFVLLKPTAEKVTEIYLSPLTYCLLSAFQEEPTAGRVLEKVSVSIESESAEELKKIQAAIELQIRELVLGHILIPFNDSFTPP